MYQYILKHEAYMAQMAERTNDFEELLSYHNQQITWIQHERLIHLIITLFTGCLFLLFAYLMFCINSIITSLLFLTMTVVLLFYIVHYIRLENKVQAWYKLSNELRQKMLNKTR